MMTWKEILCEDIREQGKIAIYATDQAIALEKLQREFPEVPFHTAMIATLQNIATMLADNVCNLTDKAVPKLKAGAE